MVPWVGLLRRLHRKLGFCSPPNPAAKRLAGPAKRRSALMHRMFPSPREPASVHKAGRRACSIERS